MEMIYEDVCTVWQNDKGEISLQLLKISFILTVVYITHNNKRVGFKNK